MRLHKRAIRVINNKRYTSNTDPLFKKSKILKIEDLFQYQAALFMYDYKYEKLPVPLEELLNKMMNFQIQEQQIKLTICT